MEVALEQYQLPGREPERFSSFLESGSYAMSYPFREGENFTVPAVLDTEIDAWLELKEAGKPTDGLIVPVPKRFAGSHTALGRFLSAAPTNHYHDRLGFLEQPLITEK